MAESPKSNETSAAICTEVRRIDDSIGVVLPAELLTRLRLKEGDKLYLIEMADGNFQLSPHSAHHAEAMAIARKVMREYHDALAALAKS